MYCASGELYSISCHCVSELINDMKNHHGHTVHEIIGVVHDKHEPGGAEVPTSHCEDEHADRIHRHGSQPGDQHLFFCGGNDCREYHDRRSYPRYLRSNSHPGWKTAEMEHDA